MLPVSHGNLELARNKSRANPAVLIHALCDLPFKPSAKSTAEKLQQWSALALTDEYCYLSSCYSAAASSQQLPLCADIMYKSLVPFKGGNGGARANWKRTGDS